MSLYGDTVERPECQETEIKVCPAFVPDWTCGSTGDCAGYRLPLARRAAEAGCVELNEIMFCLNRVGKAAGGCPDGGCGCVRLGEEVDPQSLAEKSESHEDNRNYAEPDK